MIRNHFCICPCGPVQGKAAQEGVTAFRGIRYATAGRWEYPARVKHWDGVYDATNFGPNCMGRGAFEEEDPNSFYCHEFRAGLPYTFSEDCQYLNIFAPDDAEKAPVIVYIHGGAFMGGSGWDKVFDEPRWPEKGVIAVTLNYRLGIYGAVRLPELEAEAGHAGNYNLYDQLAALEWVYENIASFGGDPNNITLMGQSAGARSVQMLVGSPRMKGIIRRAVMSSGGCIPSHLFDRVPTHAESVAFWEGWRQMLGDKSLEELRALPAKELVDSLGALFPRCGFHEVVTQVAPIYDEADFPAPESPVALPGGCLDIPYICGGNREDIVPGLAWDALDWTGKRAQPSYAYCFARALPGDEEFSWHSADLWYWFGTLNHCWRPFEASDYALSETMIGYLLNFARSGNPNGEGLPLWENSARNGCLMLFDERSEMTQEIPEPRKENTL